VIGIVMAALALGYWLGGKLSERLGHGRALFAIILLAGIFSAAIPFALAPFSRAAAKTLLAAGSDGSAIIIVGSFFVLIALFALPILLLGLVSPYIIRLLTLEDRAVGEVAGRLFAVSTAGSIFGTFVPVLVLVPLIGSKKTILAAAGALIFLGVIGISVSWRKTKAALIAAGIILAVMITPATLRWRDGLIAEKESAYEYVSVQDEKNYGRTMRFNEGLGIQSAVFADGSRTGFYWDYLPAILSSAGEREGKKKVLLIGLAGGSIARGIAAGWGDGAEITGVEINPDVISLGRKYFDLDGVRNLTIVNEDGRTFLARSKDKYDLIIVDAFTNQLYIPPHLSTVEFFKLCRERLAAGGMMSLNAVFYSEKAELYKRLTATLKAVFPAVEYYRNTGSYNYLVAAGEENFDWEYGVRAAPESIKDLAEEIQKGIAEFPDSGGRLLTDDDSPIEILTDAQVFDVLLRRG
jgi:spermidine synthase